LFAGGVVLFSLIPALPWGPAFSIQKTFAANPQVSQQVRVTVELDTPLSAVDAAPALLTVSKTHSPPANTVRVALPLQFTGVPVGAIVHADRSSVRLVRGNGVVVYRGMGEAFDVPGNGLYWQALDLPENVYSMLAEQSVRVEMEYFATVLQGVAVSGRLGLNDARRLPEFGWCATRVDSKNASVEVGCRQIGALPFCISMALRSSMDLRSPREHFVCELNYEPAPLRFSVDPIDHVEGELQVIDLGSNPEVAIRVYEPVDHFSRKVVAPQFHLRDWFASRP
jgi:hypothetical protein